jgi:hypothetical protein
MYSEKKRLILSLAECNITENFLRHQSYLYLEVYDSMKDYIGSIIRTDHDL